jgi:hypothetical protein
MRQVHSFSTASVSNRCSGVVAPRGTLWKLEALGSYNFIYSKIADNVASDQRRATFLHMFVAMEISFAPPSALQCDLQVGRCLATKGRLGFSASMIDQGYALADHSGFRFAT